MTDEFTDLHRLFLQATISRRVMTEEEAIDLYRQACEANELEFLSGDFHDFKDTLNDGLNSVELEIRTSVDETSGEKMVALTNTNGQKIAQVATGYSPTELEYFKHLLDSIITAEDDIYSISATNALIESQRLKNKEKKALVLSKKDAESLLERFVADKWFIRSSDGFYSLSMRLILELQSYLKETYEDQIYECTLCMEIITKGQRCNVSACKGRLHHHCSSRYFENQTRAACPNCQSAWTGKTIIGHVPKTGAFATGSRSSGKTTTASPSSSSSTTAGGGGSSSRPTRSGFGQRPARFASDDEKDE